MIVSLSLIMTLVVNPSLATHNSLTTMLVSITTTTATDHVILLTIGESASKMSYDSGISSGPPGGMFSSSELCCALFRILLLSERVIQLVIRHLPSKQGLCLGKQI